MSGYIVNHNDKQYTPDGQVTGVNTAEHNAELTRLELAAWATQPDKYAGYVAYGQFKNTSAPYVGQPITLETWTGAELGHGAVSNVFRNNLTGSRMVSIRIRGNNGAAYAGKFGDEWPHLCRIRRIK